MAAAGAYVWRLPRDCIANQNSLFIALSAALWWSSAPSTAPICWTTGRRGGESHVDLVRPGQCRGVTRGLRDHCAPDGAPPGDRAFAAPGSGVRSVRRRLGLRDVPAVVGILALPRRRHDYPGGSRFRSSRSRSPQLVSAEEAVFRGGMFRIVEERFGTLVGVIVSAVAFGLPHFLNDDATIARRRRDRAGIRHPDGAGLHRDAQAVASHRHARLRRISPKAACSAPGSPAATSRWG